MALSEYADWWDEQKRQSELILTEWVQDNPQWWVVGIAATVQTTKSRREGKRVIRLPAVHIKGHRPPRSDWLTGVQYRLNAAGFGAGRVDGICGPRTRKAIRAFQKAYRLRVGIPGPLTQAKLVEVCGY